MLTIIIIIRSALPPVPFDPHSTTRSAGPIGLEFSSQEATQVQEGEGPRPGHPAGGGELSQSSVLLSPCPGLCDGACDF